MLIATDRTRVAKPALPATTTPAKHGVVLPVTALGAVLLLAVMVLLESGSTGSALVAALLVNAACAPMAHVAQLHRRQAAQQARPSAEV